MKKDCVFCRIVTGELPSEKLYEDERVIVIKDINPQAPFHALVITKDHIENILDVEDYEIFSHVFKVINLVAREYGLTKKGFRIVNNCGYEGGQTIYHLHFHILGGRFMGWPPG